MKMINYTYSHISGKRTKKKFKQWCRALESRGFQWSFVGDTPKPKKKVQRYTSYFLQAYGDDNSNSAMFIERVRYRNRSVNNACVPGKYIVEFFIVDWGEGKEYYFNSFEEMMSFYELVISDD